MEIASLRGHHALKIQVSTDLKTRLDELSKALDRPLADVCRTLLWMGLPIAEGIEESRARAGLLSGDRSGRPKAQADGPEAVTDI